MSTRGIVDPYQEDWAFFAGLYDGVFGEPPESTSSREESYCSPLGREKLTRGQQLYLWALYIKGYEAGQNLSQFPEEETPPGAMGGSFLCRRPLPSC
jgi:hypothetical protein